MSNQARAVLAANLRRYREQRDISQEKLADLAGLHRTYVSSVERCQRNISIDNIARLADALEVETHQLLIPGEVRR